MAGNYYLVIHTTEYSGGEIRGQITAFTPATSYDTRLGGNSEVPPVTTAATGEGDFTLDPSLTQFAFVVRVADIQDITAAHIHRGPAGQNGPVVHALFDGSGTFDPTHPLAGNVTLSAADLADLLGNLYYVNVHTTQHSTGEIRGQIVPRYKNQIFLPLILVSP